MVMWINPSVVELQSRSTVAHNQEYIICAEGICGAPRAASLPAVSAISRAQAFGKLNGERRWTFEMATPSTNLATPLAALHATAGRRLAFGRLRHAR